MNIMAKAWELSDEGKQKFGGNKIEYFRESLKIAWSETKEAKTLKQMSKDELVALLIAVQKELEERESEDKKEYTFNFKCEFDSNKTTAYIAELYIKDNKVERSFKDLDKEYLKKYVLIDDTYTAQEGEVLEIQEGGSWKNKYRDFYIVLSGQLVKLGTTESVQNKSAIKKYLQGKITLEALKEVF